MIFYVKTEPRGKERARTFYDKRSDKMRSITPENTRNYEDLIRWSYKSYGGEHHGDKPIKVEIKAFYPIPQSWSNKKRKEAEDDLIRPKVKPDIDNCLKAVLDALNGVAYNDDKQVVSASFEKYYDLIGYLQISLEEI